jgi:Cerato-platanin
MITGWNSTNCGACYAVTHTPAGGSPKTVNILAIDVAGSGFVLSKSALDELTGNRAAEVGSVPVTWTTLPASACGMP